jgi:hypothetical protein
MPVDRLAGLREQTSSTARRAGSARGTGLASPLMVGADTRAPSGPLRLAELLASVSLATDLETGQPPGHALRTCTIAAAVAEEMGCGPDDVRTVHQFALLRFLGCTSD